MQQIIWVIVYLLATNPDKSQELMLKVVVNLGSEINQIISKKLEKLVIDLVFGRYSQ